VGGGEGEGQVMSHVGTNLQNQNKGVKVCFIPPTEDHLFFEADLSSADTATVAALCKSLGDSTMWDDLQHGVKPQWIPLIGFMDGLSSVNQSQDCLKKRGKQLAAERDDLYKGAKAATHGSNYLVKPAKGVEILLKQSNGEVLMEAKDFATLQDAYHYRYKGIKVWQEWTRERLMKDGWLRGAGGHKRRFLGRRNVEDTLRVALSELPQQNTTLATNLALEKLFYGDFNRDSRDDLKVNPCHTVHDSIVGWVHRQWLPYLDAIFTTAFDNPLFIGGQMVKIKFEYSLGPSWGEHYTEEEIKLWTKTN
jgi:hypothetical protein